MNQKNEAKLAKQLLRLKDHGYSVAYILRLSKVSYAVLFGFVAVVMLLNHTGFVPWSALMLVLGSAVGALSRDCGWFRRSKAIWPLYGKVIDWKKVQEIAEQGTANQTPQGTLA